VKPVAFAYHLVIRVGVVVRFAGTVLIVTVYELDA
jgi:hypothetical protein